MCSGKIAIDHKSRNSGSQPGSVRDSIASKHSLVHQASLQERPGDEVVQSSRHCSSMAALHCERHFRIQEASQPEHSHPPEVCSRVVALETNVLPLLGDSGFQTNVWHQLRPQLNGTRQWILNVTDIL